MVSHRDPSLPRLYPRPSVLCSSILSPPPIQNISGCRICLLLGDRAALELRKGAVVKGRVSPWLAIQREAIKAMVALSIRLRLSPQSRIDPKTLGRQQLRRGPAPWEL